MIHIIGWEKYQHYKHRNPSWIKIYSNLLDSYDFSLLSDNAKLLLFHLWLLAAKSSNKIPNQVEWLERKLGISFKKQHLEELASNGFIEMTGFSVKSESKKQPVTLENSIPEEPVSKKKFSPPTIEDLKTYIKQNNFNVSPEKFLAHYEANGWKRGKTPIKDWKACVRTWAYNSNTTNKSKIDATELL